MSIQRFVARFHFDRYDFVECPVEAASPELALAYAKLLRESPGDLIEDDPEDPAAAARIRDGEPRYIRILPLGENGRAAVL
jgi:hypothetical protein